MKSFLRIGALLVIAGVSCLAALRTIPKPAQAAVTLLYFRGQHNSDSVLLEWATATEFDTAYFYLERASAQAGPYQMLAGIGLIPSAAPPDGLSGADYQRLDEENIQAGQTYWYILVEVESGQGFENRTEPIKVAPAGAQPTSTPTRTPTPTRTATPTTVTSGSATAAATATATATATALPAGTTATPAVARTLSTRTTTTAQPAATTSAAGQPGRIADSQAETVAQHTGTATPLSDAYPEPAGELSVIAAQTDPDGYPAAPPTPQVFVTKGYPAPAGPRNLTNGDGTPVPNIGANGRAPAQDQQAESEPPSNSPALGTLFLWLGFVAALVVFISAVAGAVYYYNRQRAAKK